MRLHELTETRAGRLDALKAIASKAEAEKRDLYDAERAAFDAGRAEIEKLDRDIRNAAFLAEAEKRAHAEPITGTGDTLGAIERRFRFGKALAEHAEGRLTGAEAEWNAERRSGRMGALSVPASVFLGTRESRALTTAAPAGGPGSNLVATDLGQMIDRLRPTLAVESLGATILRGLTGNLDLPRVKSGGTAGWVADHGAATGSDVEFDKVAMSPKTVTAEYEVSRRMLLQATQIEEVLRADIGYLLAQALDGAAIKGGGSNEPTGIIANSSVPVVPLGTDGAALGLDTAADMIGALEAANAMGDRGFLTNAKVRKAAMKMKDGEGRPYGVAQVFQNEPVAYSNQVPSNLTKAGGSNLSAIIYGAWGDLVIGYWSAVDIVMNPYADAVASKGGALIHAFLDADVGIRHPESFVVCKDIVAA